MKVNKNRDKVNMDKKDLSSPTKAWQHINNHKGPKAIRGGPPTKLLIDGTETSNSVKIAEHMNKYFINKIEKLAKSLPEDISSKSYKCATCDTSFTSK